MQTLPQDSNGGRAIQVPLQVSELLRLDLTERCTAVMRTASVSWTAAPARAERLAGEESPGSIDIRCRITSGGGDPRDSATENEPPACALWGFGVVRVKRCGKSAPRVR